MRELTHHVVSGDSANHQLSVTVIDEPGAGGACHAYVIGGFDTSTNVSEQSEMDHQYTVILFQNGPIKEVGVNGVTHEALLAILIDRMESFQKGDYACHDNEVALGDLRTALFRLQKRTRERIARGVEGTHTK